MKAHPEEPSVHRVMNSWGVIQISMRISKGAIKKAK